MFARQETSSSRTMGERGRKQSARNGWEERQTASQSVRFAVQIDLSRRKFTARRVINKYRGRISIVL